MSFQDMLKKYNIPYTPKKEGHSWGTVIIALIITIVAVLGIVAVAGLVTMWLWNFVFPIYPLTFLQGTALVFLSAMLFSRAPNSK